MDLPYCFTELLNTASLELKHLMFTALSNNIKSTEEHNHRHKPSPSPAEVVADLVEHIDDPEIDDTLYYAITDELESLHLNSGQKNKVKTKWLSPTSDDYNYAKVVNNPTPINNYTNICKLMALVNNHPSTSGDMDACLVSCFPSEKARLTLHKDNEKLICQTSSICTISFGAPRELEFVLDGKPKKKKKNDISADLSLPATDRTMNVMKPGAQSKMKHRVLEGKSSPDHSSVRYSLSFRKIVRPGEESLATPKALKVASNIKSPDNNKSGALPVPPKDSTQVLTKNIVLVAGDSFAARLDAKRLGKGKQDVINIAKGGSKITRVQKSLEDFVKENPKLLVKKLFLSIGTNDIRNCSNGIKHLKNSICDLMRRIKELFPAARVYIQAIPPIHPNGCRFTENNVILMNNLIFNLCSRFKLFYLDVFGCFLDNFGNRDKYLFPDFDNIRNIYDIHPNAKGMGVLAKCYIYCIHSRWFNPLGY